jgi:hypothetical protein
VTGTAEQDLFQRASVQRSGFSQLEIVLVITDFEAVDFTPLLPTPGALRGKGDGIDKFSPFPPIPLLHYHYHS